MLLSALIALSGGQIPPIDSTIATPPDNQTALFCTLNNAGQEVCFDEYCKAYPNDCTSAFAPTLLLPKLNRTQLADDIGDGSSSAALPQVEQTIAFN
jgi:hypothetical protein